MNQKAYFLVCGVVFFAVAAAHLTRLIDGWDVVVDGWDAPYWISIPGLVVPGLLSAWGFVLALRDEEER
jgi:hypothetical protein